MGAIKQLDTLPIVASTNHPIPFHSSGFGASTGNAMELMCILCGTIFGTSVREPLFQQGTLMSHSTVGWDGKFNSLQLCPEGPLTGEWTDRGQKRG